MNGVLNRRDMDVAVHSFTFTNAARGPHRHYVNTIFASREDISPIVVNVVDKDIENQVLEATAIEDTARAAEVTVATDSSTNVSTFPNVEFLDTDNAFPPSIPETEEEQEHQAETIIHDIDSSRRFQRFRATSATTFVASEIA
jgi:hypothetical protein